MANRHLALGAVLLCGSLAAHAQTFHCVGKDGKKYYGSTVPPQCVGQPIEQLNSQGRVVRRMDPAGEEAAKAAKEAELAKKREQDAINKEESRRNRALLATYTSEKDIEDARARALSENQKALKQVEARIAEIQKRQAGFDKEMEFYRDTPKPAADKGGKAKPEAKPEAKAKAGPKPPPKLLEDMQSAETDLKLQQTMLDQRKKEAETINAKYDEDKKRYRELTRPAGK